MNSHKSAPSTPDRPAFANPYIQVVALVASMALIALGNGLMATYVPIRLNAAGEAQGAVGFVVTAYAGGMLLGCLFSGLLVRRSGHVRAFAALAALGTISALLLAVDVGLANWAILRIVGGFCTTGMFMVSQSWLNAVTQSAWRGRVMAVFYISYTLGLGGGALIMGQVALEGTSAVMILAGLYAAAVIPIGLTRLAQPTPPQRILVRPLAVYRISPVGLAGAFVSGGLGMTMMGVGPMYGTAIGLEPAAIALLIASLQGGNLLIQWPLGALSDRIDRRLVILIAALGVVGLSLAVALGGEGLALKAFWLLLVLFALWGGLAESLYTIATAHTNDHTDADDHVMVSSTILIVWASGATVGPAIATLALDQGGTLGLWAFFFGEAALFAGFVVWRRTRREQPTDASQEPFISWPAYAPPIPEWQPYAPENLARSGEDVGGGCDEIESVKKP